MNKFCFTQSESNKSYCKTQSSIIYIPLLIYICLLIVSLSSQLTLTVLKKKILQNKTFPFFFLMKVDTISCPCQGQLR